MSSIPCDIVLLPDDELAQKAISASQLMASRDAFFTLETGKFYAHSSLYMCQLDTDDVVRVEDILAKLAQATQVITAKATNYEVSDGAAVGYVDVEYEATQTLRDLQNTVVEAINPIRNGMRERDIAKMKQAKGLKLENLQKYGYQSIGDLFRPHITLTRLKDYHADAAELLPPIETLNGAFVKIGLFEMGDNGTCVRMIKAFDLLPN